jgi:hypothetical protein
VGGKAATVGRESGAHPAFRLLKGRTEGKTDRGPGKKNREGGREKGYEKNGGTDLATYLFYYNKKAVKRFNKIFGSAAAGAAA